MHILVQNIDSYVLSYPIRPNMIITMIKSGGPTYVHNSHSDFTTLNNYISIYKLFHCSFAVVLLNEVLDGNLDK